MEKTPPALDLSRLLGFDGLRDTADRPLDFKSDRISAALGAKVGTPEPGTPATKG